MLLFFDGKAEAVIEKLAPQLNTSHGGVVLMALVELTFRRGFSAELALLDDLNYTPTEADAADPQADTD